MTHAKFLLSALTAFLMPLGTALGPRWRKRGLASRAGHAGPVLGIAGIGGVFVIHLGQSASEEDD